MKIERIYRGVSDSGINRGYIQKFVEVDIDGKDKSTNAYLDILNCCPTLHNISIICNDINNKDLQTLVFKLTTCDNSIELISSTKNNLPSERLLGVSYKIIHNFDSEIKDWLEANKDKLEYCDSLVFKVENIEDIMWLCKETLPKVKSLICIVLKYRISINYVCVNT